jgi:hypothetical protein
MLGHTLRVIEILKINWTCNLRLNSFGGCAPEILQSLSDIASVNKH